MPAAAHIHCAYMHSKCQNVTLCWQHTESPKSPAASWDTPVVSWLFWRPLKVTVRSTLVYYWGTLSFDPNCSYRLLAGTTGRQTPRLQYTHEHVTRPLTRNLRFCFQCAPWALVCRWASVTRRISSHSAPVGSGRFCRDFTISSFLRRSRFSSIRRLFATRFESSSTTGRRRKECVIITCPKTSNGMFFSFLCFVCVSSCEFVCVRRSQSMAMPTAMHFLKRQS